MRPPGPTSLFDGLDLDLPHLIDARLLLRKILSLEPSSGRKVFMITSATQQEGKSTTCALLSLVAAAKFGKRTLAIDGDARRPGLHDLLGVAPGVGLCEVLQGSCAWRDAVQSTHHPRLTVMASGRGRGPVAEVYGDAPFQQLVDEVREAYDLLMVDTPPVLPVIEPLLMGEHVDGILVVVMAGRTRVHLVRRMRDTLKPIAHKIAGCIVNNARGALPYYYDYSSYDYKPKRRPALRIFGRPVRSGRVAARGLVR